jgi:putative redox protein
LALDFFLPELYHDSIHKELQMEMKITLGDGKQVETVIKGHVIKTDQPVSGGGTDTAPSPFDLFLASLGTCAGFYVLSFCQQRGIPYNGIHLTQKLSFHPQSHMIGQIDLEIHLPATFPEKYRNAVAQAANSCTVKKHLETPPIFSISTVIDPNLTYL